jgi:hypothetical protein
VRSIAVLVTTALALVVAGAACGPPEREAASPGGPPEAASTAGSPAPPGAGAQRYEDEARTFSILFPMPFSIDVRKSTAGTSELLTTTASATTADERVNYLVVKTVMEPVVSYDCERAITTNRDKTLQAFGCKATAETPIAGKRWPGREVAFSCTMRGLSGMLAIYCDDSAVASDKRATMVEIFTASSQPLYDEAKARAFLGSFTPAK